MYGWKDVQDKTVGGLFPKNLFIRKASVKNFYHVYDIN